MKGFTSSASCSRVSIRTCAPSDSNSKVGFVRVVSKSVFIGHAPESSPYLDRRGLVVVSISGIVVASHARDSEFAAGGKENPAAKIGSNVGALPRGNDKV